MVLVDTHAHVSPHWFEPLEALLFHMESSNVEKGVLLQFSGQEDNSYIFDCARRFPGRFAPIVFVDHKRADAAQALKELVKRGADGIRLRTSVRSPGKDDLALWRCCNELHLVVSCQCTARDLGSDDFYKLAESMSDISFVIEHFGHFDLEQQPPYNDLKKILALAKLLNVYVKVGGVGEICERPNPFREPFDPVRGVPPFIKMFYEAFGPQRMMWASAFPGVCHNEGYANSIKYLMDHLSSFCNEEAKGWIMGKTALSLFKFR